jgi:hypothetical protein
MKAAKTSLWRRAPLQHRTATTPTTPTDDDHGAIALSVSSSPARQQQPTITTSSTHSNAIHHHSRNRQHHHHHHHHLLTIISSPHYKCPLKQNVYFQWMAVLMFALFVSTLSTFRWSRHSYNNNNKLDNYNNRQLPQYYHSPMMMTTMIQYPSIVTLSKLDSDMIHAPPPPPPKQKRYQDEKDEEIDRFEVVHWNPDYGGLNVRMIPDDDVPRTLFRHGDDLRNSYMSKGDGDDEVNYYYLVDDDVARNPYNGYDDDKVKKENKLCRKTSWQEEVYHNCNTFHEFGFERLVLNQKSKHIG